MDRTPALGHVNEIGVNEVVSRPRKPDAAIISRPELAEDATVWRFTIKGEAFTTPGWSVEDVIDGIGIVFAGQSGSHLPYVEYQVDTINGERIDDEEDGATNDPLPSE